MTLTNIRPSINNTTIRSIEAATGRNCEDKSFLLRTNKIEEISQSSQLDNQDAIVSFSKLADMSQLGDYCTALFGSGAGDKFRFIRQMWEVDIGDKSTWEFHQTTLSNVSHFGGRDEVILWENESGQMCELAISVKHLNHKAQQWRSGKPNWGKKGVSVSLMGDLPGTIYTGDIYAAKCTAIVPNDQSTEMLMAIWYYCESGAFLASLRKQNPKLAVEVKELLQVPFCKDDWLIKGREKYPTGLPLPYTNDPTQWIFHGHPCGSVLWDEEQKCTVESGLRIDDTVLQVAVVRLLGYLWPAELDAGMELATEQRAWVDRCAALAPFVDDDGIVCLPAVRGEKAADLRLEAMLEAAYRDAWTVNLKNQLLNAVGSKSLAAWLREKFFEQHCKLFQHRPFIWQIWDGLKDGFSVLVNYHKLDKAGLERLIYTYLGDWIRTQQAEIANGVDGADVRLGAAQALKQELENILVGEKPYDIFVRWKPDYEQPIGWNPDINDGVRLNIRPFMLANDMGKKGAGILRAKPNIHWQKDRGTDIESAPWYDLGLQYGEKEGARINEHHLTLAQKHAARDKAGK